MDRPSERDNPLHLRALKSINRLVCRAYHQVDVFGACRIPKTGPAIIVSNHISGADPMIIQSVVPRVIVWMMAKEYYDLPILGKFFRAIEAIPVSRDGKDSAALRAALRALANGRVLGIFPEGRIATDHALLPLQTGAALIAMRTKAPVFPCYLAGTTRKQEMVRAVLHPAHVRLRFGDRIDLGQSDSRDLNAPTERLRLALQQLHDQDRGLKIG